MKRKEKIAKLWKLTIDVCQRESYVSTWHLNDYLYDAAEIMGWNSGSASLVNTQANLRRQLNKWVKEGKLKKQRTGTGFLGYTDFGVRHSTNWYIPGGSLDQTILRADAHYQQPQ